MDEKILIQRLLDVLNDWDLNCSEEPELKLEIARQQATVVKLLYTPAVSVNEVAVCFNRKCPFDMNKNNICGYGDTKCTAKQTVC